MLWQQVTHLSTYCGAFLVYWMFFPGLGPNDLFILIITIAYNSVIFDKSFFFLLQRDNDPRTQPWAACVMIYRQIIHQIITAVKYLLHIFQHQHLKKQRSDRKQMGRVSSTRWPSVSPRWKTSPGRLFSCCLSENSLRIQPWTVDSCKIDSTSFM